MAKSRWEYVKQFELSDQLLPRTWLIVRVDGCSFHKFSDDHGFDKPNDANALDLMTLCARKVMEKFPQIRFAYGQSDEYSFAYPPKSFPYTRRSAKLASISASTFAGWYSFSWSKFFPTTSLQYPPSFDARVVQYPNSDIVRDYLKWRQADCHINNLYNTTLWALIKGGLPSKEATKRLNGTNSSDKNELLFKDFGINYNNERQLFRKGTFLYRTELDDISETQESIISDKFWTDKQYLLNN